MRLNRTKPIFDDAARGKRERAFLADIANTSRTITIRLQRNHLRGDALADAAAECMAICWEVYSRSNRSIHNAIGYAIAEKRTELRERRKAQRELAEANWPDTMTDRIVWEYADGDIAIAEAPVPAVPIETPETRKRRFVRPTDWHDARYPRLASVTIGDMEAEEMIEADNAAGRLAQDAAWIGCQQMNLLAAIERSLEADAG
jgi:hypothetical protein